MDFAVGGGLRDNMDGGPHPTHRTFSCQGSLRATAEGSSGSRLKAVGV